MGTIFVRPRKFYRVLSDSCKESLHFLILMVIIRMVRVVPRFFSNIFFQFPTHMIRIPLLKST